MGKRQVTTLFQDLSKAIDNEELEYFLGTIVTIPLELDALEVVDGQQRLATVAILLAEIRNYMKGIGEEVIARRIDNVFSRRNRSGETRRNDQIIAQH